MANFKLVNSDQLDSDLKKVADSIREKGETKNSLTFPDGFVSAVKAIETGSKTTVKKVSGTGSISGGSGSVNCGFRPDVVVFGSDFCFYLENGSFTSANFGSDNETVSRMTVSASNTGFTISNAKYYRPSGSSNISTSFNYMAIKYTE